MSTLVERGIPVPSIGSLFAGLLFGAGWYVWIDGCAWASHVHGYQVNGVYWVPGLLQTLSLVMVNILNWGMLSDESAFDGDNSAAMAKCWVFTAFVVAFSGVIGSVWIMVNENNLPTGDGSMWPAVAGLLQNVLIFLGSLIFRFARMQEPASF